MPITIHKLENSVIIGVDITGAQKSSSQQQKNAP
jgi:hypothetical protein